MATTEENSGSSFQAALLEWRQTSQDLEADFGSVQVFKSLLTLEVERVWRCQSILPIVTSLFKHAETFIRDDPSSDPSSIQKDLMELIQSLPTVFEINDHIESLIPSETPSDTSRAKEQMIQLLHFLHNSQSDYKIQLPVVMWPSRFLVRNVPGKLDFSLPAQPTDLQLTSAEALRVRHATTAHKLVAMLTVHANNQPSGLILKGRRETGKSDLHDVYSQGLIYCGVDTDHLDLWGHAKENRYGSAVIKFELEPRRHFYILGSKQYMFENSQMLISSTSPAEWMLYDVQSGKIMALQKVDLDDEFRWNLSRPKNAWAHPEIVIPEKHFIPLGGFKIEFRDHKCIRTRGYCAECNLWLRRDEHPEYLKDDLDGQNLFSSWRDSYRKYNFRRGDTCPLNLGMDLFAYEMYKDTEKWNAVKGHFNDTQVGYICNKIDEISNWIAKRNEETTTAAPPMEQSSAGGEEVAASAADDGEGASEPKRPRRDDDDLENPGD